MAVIERPTDTPVVTDAPVVTASSSYGYLLSQKLRGGTIELRHPLGFLEYCHARGAGGIQIGLAVRDEQGLFLGVFFFSCL